MNNTKLDTIKTEAASVSIIFKTTYLDIGFCKIAIFYAMIENKIAYFKTKSILLFKVVLAFPSVSCLVIELVIIS